MPWAITTLTALLTPTAGAIVVLARNVPWHKLPPDAPDPYYQTILLRATPTIISLTLVLTVGVWLVERKSRRLRDANG